jgi:nucleotide-binding universal stress UspA family protein
MTTKLLIPLDGSKSAMRAVEYVAKTFGQTPEVEIILIHIFPQVPPSLRDEGQALTTENHPEGEALVSYWEKQWEGIFARAREKLMQAGIAAEAISTKFQPQYGDIAEDILDQAALEECSTIVIGRRGLTGAARFFLGSVSHKVVSYARGIAVLIVDYAQVGESQEVRFTRVRERRKSIPRDRIKQGGWEKFINFSKYWSWV